MEWFQLTGLLGFIAFILGGYGSVYLSRNYISSRKLESILGNSSVISLLGGIVGIIVAIIGWIASW